VDGRRRAAALGGILAALDTGIGSGSIATGWLIEHMGYAAAFGTGAVIALFAVPYTLSLAPRIMAGHARAAAAAAAPSSAEG
jgi:hypothetical protein